MAFGRHHPKSSNTTESSEHLTGPEPESLKRPGIRERLRERFKEKPATEAEVEQLKLDAQREKLKSDKYKYKHARPSVIGKVLGTSPRNNERRRPVGRPRQYPRRSNERSTSFGGNSQGGGFGNGSFGGSLLDPHGSDSMGSGGDAWQGSGLDSMLGGRGGLLSNNNNQKRPVGRPKQGPKTPPFGTGLKKLFG